MGEAVTVPSGGSATIAMTFSGFLERVGPGVEPVARLPNLPIPPTFKIVEPDRTG